MMDGYGKRVLVVEDDDDVRTLIGVILRETGYNVYEAGDGLEAITPSRSAATTSCSLITICPRWTA